MSLRLLGILRGTVLHPQWLSDRFHIKSRKILRRLNGAKILDVGSGNSSYDKYIEASNELYRLDYPDTNKRYLVSPQIFADARCLPVATAKMDAVLLFEVLEHIAETESVIMEVQRVLRPGGELYISVPFLYPMHDEPHDFWRFTIYGITKILKDSGFVVKKKWVHGNTIITAMQMFNLALLEICQRVYKFSGLLGVLLGGAFYPFLILINFMSIPVLYLPGKAGCFGYFLVASLGEDEP